MISHKDITATETKELYLECKDCSIVITQWGNYEGINVVVTNKDLSLRMAGALRNEEAAALAAALNITMT